MLKRDTRFRVSLLILLELYPRLKVKQHLASGEVFFICKLYFIPAYTDFPLRLRERGEAFVCRKKCAFKKAYAFFPVSD